MALLNDVTNQVKSGIRMMAPKHKVGRRMTRADRRTRPVFAVVSGIVPTMASVTAVAGLLAALLAVATVSPLMAKTIVIDARDFECAAAPPPAAPPPAVPPQAIPASGGLADRDGSARPAPSTAITVIRRAAPSDQAPGWASRYLLRRYAMETKSAPRVLHLNDCVTDRRAD